MIEEWSQGLEWVHWLLSGVRARSERLVFGGGVWAEYAQGAFRAAIGPGLQKAWSAAHSGDLSGLLAADRSLDALLEPADAQRSKHAGAVLLAGTRQARYQGVLGHFRDQIGSGQSSGHLAVVWAAVGHFFHLSLANVIAEYLRLEWEIGTRSQIRRREPPFAALTSELLLAGNHIPHRL